MQPLLVRGRGRGRVRVRVGVRVRVRVSPCTIKRRGGHCGIQYIWPVDVHIRVAGYAMGTKACAATLGRLYRVK